MTKGIEQFEARVARFVSENNLEALEELRTKLIITQETRRIKFAKTRDMTTGKLYRMCGLQLGAVNAGIRQLKAKQPIDEAGIADKLKNMVSTGVRDARDRVLHGLGSREATGRLDLSAATKKLHSDWSRYVGREVAAGDRQIKSRPTIRNLVDFLEFTYGIEADEEDLERILGGQATEPENAAPEPSTAAGAPKKAPRTADSVARDALKKTSPAEYAALKAKFGKPTKASAPDEADMAARKAALRKQMLASESVMESIDDVTFDPQTMFPRLANMLIRNGLFKVERDGETLSAAPRSRSGGGAPAEDDNTPEPQTKSARVTKDGHAIDVNKMTKMMERDGITGPNMAELKKLMAAPQAQAISSVYSSGSAVKTLVSLVTALLGSISKDNDQAAKSLTPSGHTMDINVFRDELAHESISGDDMNAVRNQLEAGGESALMKAFLDTRGPMSKTIYGMANAALRATGTVKKKGD